MSESRLQHSIPAPERAELNAAALAGQTHFHQTIAAIDPETGYQDELECECRACKECDGEGGGTSWCETVRTCRVDGGCYGHAWICSTCKGTGKITEDCGIHGDVSVFPRGGALALGGEWEADEVPAIPKIAARVQMPAKIAEVA